MSEVEATESKFKSFSIFNYLNCLHSSVAAIRSVAVAAGNLETGLSLVPEEATAVVESVPVVVDLSFRRRRRRRRHIAPVAVAVQAPAEECPGSVAAELAAVEEIWSPGAVELAIFFHLSSYRCCRR